MKIATTLFLFVVVGCTWREALNTCVLESDFGFVLNCAFKKSGLFRVRNLGGVKGYVGLGFSVGDELGFRDSLSNTEALSKRRSVQDGRGNFIAINPSNVAVNRDGSRVVPPFKPLPPGGTRPMAPQPERQRLVVQQNSTALKTIPAPALGGMKEEMAKQQEKLLEEEKIRHQQRIQQEVLAMQMLKQQRLQQQEAMRKQQLQKIAQQQQIQKIAQQQMQQQQIQKQQLQQQQMPQQQMQQQIQQQQMQQLQQQQMPHQQMQQQIQQQQMQQQMQHPQIQQQMQQQQIQQQMQQQQMQQQQLKQQQQMAAIQTKRVQVVQGSTSPVARLPTIVAAIPPAGSVVNDPLPKPVAGIVIPSSALPPFIAMPKSSAQLTNRISHSPTLLEDSVNEVSKDDDKLLPIPGDDVPSQSNKLTLLSFPQVSVEPLVEQSVPEQQNGKRQSIPPSMVNSLQSSGKNSLPSSIKNSLPSLEPIQGMETSLKALAEASNITLEALEAAILLRQQQLLQKQEGPTTTTTTTTTTTSSPVKNNNYSGTTKVMNAPREYYPVGYDKNFDDNFASRVDLPDTSFYCGDQKHFPGLYADEDLGCMVFHVCALTDDGLIMKSFLCPESTLFDQTILKCNWWFYVDCKSSKTLYDSNIPISKSYQLMKALAFFSAYKNHDNSTVQETEPEEARSV